MRVIQPIKIVLDRERSLLFNHRALFKAEQEINRIRGARPDEHLSIDFLMIDLWNRIIRVRNMPPLDLTLVMLWAGLLHEETLTLDETAALMDRAQVGSFEVAAIIWKAYFEAAGANLITEKTDDEPEDEAKKKEHPVTGSSDGVLRSRN